VMPEALIDTADLVGRAALGASLVTVGAGLAASRLARICPALAVAGVLRLVAMPLIAAAYAAFAGLDGAALGVAVVAAAVPTSSGAYVLARQMNGDAALMAEIIATQTLASALTFPLMMALLAL